MLFLFNSRQFTPLPVLLNGIIYLMLFFGCPLTLFSQNELSGEKLNKKDETENRLILEQIDSYRTYDPAGYVISGTITSEFGVIRNLTIYSRHDGTFVKITDNRKKRLFYGLKSPTSGVLYVNSISQKWSPKIPFINGKEINFGDLLIPSFSEDYSIIKIETNLNSEDKIITLIPKNLNVPYGKIILVVNPEYLPLKAELYSVAGEIKHYVDYKKYKQVGDKIKRSKMVFTSTIYQTDPVYVDFAEYKKVVIEGDFFSVNNLSFFSTID